MFVTCHCTNEWTADHALIKMLRNTETDVYKKKEARKWNKVRHFKKKKKGRKCSEKCRAEADGKYDWVIEWVVFLFMPELN